MSVDFENRVANFKNGINHMYNKKKAIYNKKNENLKKAYNSFYMSASENYALAFRELGLLFYRGKYVKQNLIIAGLLFIKANEIEPTICRDMIYMMEKDLSLIFFRVRGIYNWINILSLIYPGQKPNRDYENEINMIVSFNFSRRFQINNSPFGHYIYHSAQAILSKSYSAPPIIIRPIQVIPVLVNVYGRLRERKYEQDPFVEPFVEPSDEGIPNPYLFEEFSFEGVGQTFEPDKVIDEPECSICLLPYDDNDTKELSCRHKFHPKCISDWLMKSKTCPECRKEI